MRVAIVGTFDLENYGDLLFPLLARHELERRVDKLELLPFSYHSKDAGAWPYQVHSVGYVDRPLEPVHLLDTSGSVVYVGSFSKTLSPSLRLGFVVAPPAVVDELTRTRHVMDTQPPHLTQAALAAFLTTGAYDRHVRRCRRDYRKRRDHLVSLLGRLVDDEVIAGFDRCDAGLHTTIQLLPDTAAEDLAAQLRSTGIAVTTTAQNCISEGPIDLLVGFGLADERQLDTAIDAIRRAIDG